MVTQYVYDAQGRRIEEHLDPAGLNQVKRYSYDNNGNLVSATDALGNVTRYAYDAADRPVYTVDGAGNVRKNSYDLEGRVTAAVAYAQPIALDGLGTQVTVAEIDARVTATPGQDALEQRVYDKDGRVRYSVDGAGGVTAYTYDGNGNVTERIGYANRIDLGAWVPGTAPAVVADAACDMRVRAVYDANNRAIYQIDGTGAVKSVKYDGNGNVVETIAYANRIPVATEATASAIEAALVADPARDQHVRKTYDSANRLTWSVNGVGAVSQFVYDHNGNQIKRVDYATALAPYAEPDSVTTSVADIVSVAAYDNANRMTFMVDANGGVTRHVYDATGNLTARIAYATPIAAPTADGAGAGVDQLTSALQPNGLKDRVTRMTYDAAGENVFVVDAEGNVTETRYDGNGRVVEVVQYAKPVDARGLSLSPASDDVRALITADGAHDRKTARIYDSAGQVSYLVDPEGYVRHFEYDGQGRLTSVTQYAAPVAAGTPADVIAALVPNADVDQVTTYRYDALGNLIGSTDALGLSDAYTYDGLAQKLSYTDKNGATWNYEYDAAGRLIVERSPQVAVTAVVTDSQGNLVVDETGSGYVRVETRIAYDAFGNVASRTEAANTPEARTAQYEYDALGRQTKVIHAPVSIYDADADNLSTNGANGLVSRTEKVAQLYSETVYDTLGNVVATRDLAGNYAYKAYDKLGRVAYDLDTLGYVTGYERNAFGNVVATTRYAATPGFANSGGAAPDAQEIATALESVAHGDDRTTLFNYDRLGQVVQVTEPEVWVSEGQLGRLASKITRYFYNAFGELSKEAVLDDATTNTWAVNTYHYDLDGRNTAIVDAMGYVTTRVYDAAGNVTRVTEYANASTAGQAELTLPTESIKDRTTVYAYDAANRMVSQTRLNVQFSDGTKDVAGGARSYGDVTTTYSYDAVGNRTVTTDALGGRTYATYDALGRITSMTGPAVAGKDGTIEPLTVYRRDAMGNVVAKIEYANGSTAVASADDRITVARYDSFGNMTQRTDAIGVSHFTSYDEGQRVRKQWQSVTGSDGKKHTLFAAFEYDAAGRVTAKITPGSNVIFDRSTDKIRTVDQSTVASARDELEYNAFGEVVQERNAGGKVTNFSYDRAGRLWRTSAGNGDTEVMLYDLQGNRTSTLSSAGMASRSLYGDADPLVNVASAEQADKKLGLRRTDVVLDLLGRATATILPARDGVRPVVHQTFDRWGNVLSRSTLNGAASVNVYEYDANNQAISVKQPDGNGQQSAGSPVTEYYYDRLGRQIAVRDQNGNVNQQSWDAAGNLSEELHADGGVVKHYYNAFGEEIAVRDAENHLTSVRRDDVGRVVETSTDLVGVYQIGANGTLTGGLQHLVSTTQYDEAGHVVAQTNGAGETTRYDVDLRGNVTAVHQPMGQKEMSAYDVDGHVIANTDANGALETWAYDANGRLQERTDIGSAAYTYVYDSAGQLVQQTNTRGQDIRTTYDGAGQVTQIRDMADGKTTQYAYNLAGQHTRELTVQNGVLYQDNSLAYDSLGRLARIDALADRVSVLMEYDKVGNLVHQRTVQQARPAGTLLQQVRIDGVNQTVARGLATLPSKVEDLWYAYDGMNRQIMSEGAVSANPADPYNLSTTQGHLVTYDKNGNRISDTYQGSQLVAQIGADGRTRYVVHQGRITMHYRYDAAGRLSEAAVGTVDAQGNALDASYATVVSQNYYDAAGRLIQSGSGNKLPSGYAQAAVSNPDAAYGTDRTVSSYDANGRLLRERITKLSGELVRDTSYAGGYDAAGNVMSYVVTDKNGVATTNVIRVRLDDYKRISTTTTKVAPNGIAAVTSSTYAYDRGGHLVHINSTSALGTISTREFQNDLDGYVMQTKDGNTVTNRLVVDGRTYAVWLGRPVSGLSSFSMMSVGTMSAGASVAESQAVTASSVADPAGISALYWKWLKREPDAGGMAFWTAAMEQGATLADIEEAILASSEYQELKEAEEKQRQDAIRTEQVIVVFGLLLGRAVEHAELDHWKDALADGMSLNEVAVQIMASPEYINRQRTLPDLGNFDDRDYMIVQRLPGDTLESLARAAYNNPNLSYLIGQANNVTSSAELSKLDAVVIPDYISQTDDGVAFHYRNERTGRTWSEYYTPMVSLLDPLDFPEFDVPPLVSSNARLKTTFTLPNGEKHIFKYSADSLMAKTLLPFFPPDGETRFPNGQVNTLHPGGSSVSGVSGQPSMVPSGNLQIGVGGPATGAAPSGGGATAGMQQVVIRGDAPAGNYFGLTAEQMFWLQLHNGVRSAPATVWQPTNPINSSAQIHYHSQTMVIRGDGSYDYETQARLPDGTQQITRHIHIDQTTDAINSFIDNALNGVADTVLEPVKQVLDLGQIGLGVFTNGRYEPTWYSGIGQAYEGGVSKDEIFLRGVLGSNAIAGLGITIYDVAEQLKKEDWNGAAGTIGNVIGGMISGKVASKAADTKGKVTESWKPQGINQRGVDLEVGEQMIAGMQKDRDGQVVMDREIAKTLVDALLKTGATVPVARTVSEGDILVKIVPQGAGVSDISPFWTTMDALQAELSNPTALADRFALPPTNAGASVFDIMQVTVNTPTTVFDSIVAPTLDTATGKTQGGGATQSLIVNRSYFSEAVIIGQIVANPAGPGG